MSIYCNGMETRFIDILRARETAILLNSTEVSAHKVCLSLKKVHKSGLAIQRLVNW